FSFIDGGTRVAGAVLPVVVLAYRPIGGFRVSGHKAAQVADGDLEHVGIGEAQLRGNSFAVNEGIVFRVFFCIYIRRYEGGKGVHPHAPVGSFARLGMVELMPVGVLTVPRDAVMGSPEFDGRHLFVVYRGKFNALLFRYELYGRTEHPAT